MGASPISDDAFTAFIIFGVVCCGEMDAGGGTCCLEEVPPAWALLLLLFDGADVDP